MKHALLATAAALALSLGSTQVWAKDLPEGGLTLGEVASWLTDAGYQAKVETDNDGTRNIASSADGGNFHIYLYDCKDDRCGSLQFSSGFDTKGAWDTAKMNEWSRTKRWARAYVYKVNDPWLEYDVDLTPGGTYEMLNDEFDIWKQSLTNFRKYINW
jgi:hypothetical protein